MRLGLRHNVCTPLSQSFPSYGNYEDFSTSYSKNILIRKPPIVGQPLCLFLPTCCRCSCHAGETKVIVLKEKNKGDVIHSGIL